MKIIYLLFCLSVLLGSCSRQYYLPNTHNIPMHNSKGDITISGGSGGEILGAEYLYLHSDYSIAANWLISGSYSHVLNSGVNFLELGGGYYTHNGTFYTQFLGSIGYGHGDHTWDESTQYLEASGFRYTLTPAVGLDFEYGSIAISNRFSYLNYFDITETSDGEPIAMTDPYSLENYPRQFYIEPAITMQLKYDPMGYQIQIILPQNVTNSNIVGPNFIISAGVNILLDK